MTANELSVLVVGSINVDLVVTTPSLPSPGSTVIGGTFCKYGGGKGANQAVAAARLGASVGVIGAVGIDAVGGDAMEDLVSEAVEVSGVSRLEGVATGVALIMVDAEGNNQIAVASGANARLDGRLVREALRDVVMASGGVCVVNFEINNDALEAVARWCSGVGVPLVVNPAPARSIPEPLVVSSPILTPNAGEAMDLTGESDARSAAQVLHERTGAPVVVTLGEHGVLVHDRDVVELFEPYSVSPVDTTGAGDTFTGALAVGLAEGSGLFDAVDMAQAAAALSTQAPGARTAMPTRDAVARLLSDS